MRSSYFAVVCVFCLVLGLGGCGKKSEPATAEPSPSTSTGPMATAGQTKAEKPSATMAVATIVPAGTAITVRLGQAVGSKISNSGESFAATVASPVSVNGTVVIPAGATAQGTVAEAAPRGRFKGGARLRLTLNSITVNGSTKQIQAAAVSRAIKGKGKRTAVMVGGGAGLGALIGGIAGGGKGAAIGAAAGAGAGTAGSAFTGNQDIVLPAESALTFKLLQPLEVKK
jgi:hypothetical protein